jgi:hypothetical protein
MRKCIKGDLDPHLYPDYLIVDGCEALRQYKQLLDIANIALQRQL